MTPDPRDLEFMRAALAEAECAFARGEVPIGAVAVESGCIIARSFNTVETDHSVSSHAEFNVIAEVEKLRSDWRMTGVTLYVTKEPCPMCAGMLVNCRVSRIVFGVPDPAFGGCGGAVNIPALPQALWHPQVLGGVAADAAAQLLKDFFRQKRK